MVTAAPNLTRLTGRVRSCAPSESFPGWLQVDLELDGVEGVPGIGSLVRAEPGETVSFAVAPGLLPGDLRPDRLVGARLDCRVALTPKGLRAEPSPAPENFTVSSA